MWNLLVHLPMLGLICQCNDRGSIIVLVALPVGYFTCWLPVLLALCNLCFYNSHRHPIFNECVLKFCLLDYSVYLLDMGVQFS